MVVSTKDENYKKIAEAIREHGKINRKFKPNEMADGVKLVYDKGCEEGIDGYLGRAGHKWREHDGEPAVAHAGQGAAAHHTGHTASETQEQGHYATAGETEFSQWAVHHKGYACHVSAILHH